jgi:hypothetical protein
MIGVLNDILYDEMNKELKLLCFSNVLSLSSILNTSLMTMRMKGMANLLI